MKSSYIVAVSGGVDSCVLLHMLMTRQLFMQDTSAKRRLQDERQPSPELIVAHIDHGIRPESREDAAFVRQLAESYGLQFESIRYELGPRASEALAREKRWEFLRDIKNRYQADAIVTAHHADDVIETMIINLMRGTGWRGIATLVETNRIKRPLLRVRKADIEAYALQWGIEWRQDQTNDEITYLRNRVRHMIIPYISKEQFAHFIELHDKQCMLRSDIENEAQKRKGLDRHMLIMSPDSVAYELLRAEFGSLTRQEQGRLLLFARVARRDRHFFLTTGVRLKATVKQLIVLEGED